MVVNQEDILDACKFQFLSDLTTLKEQIDKKFKKMLKKKEKSDTTSFLNKKAFTSTKAELEQRMKNLEQQID